MAIDKSRTPLWMKIVLIALAGTFVIGMGGVGLVALLEPSSSSTTATSNNTTQDASATLDAITSSFGPQTKTGEEALKKDPKNYALLVAQANAYHDWGGAVLQALQNDQAKALESAVPMWLAAVQYYERALKVKAGDPNVETDLAIARFYSGDAGGAIKTVLAVIKANPKFAPARFNLGYFYLNTGQNALSIASYQQYLSIEPTGSLADVARQGIASAQKAAKSGTATTAP